MEWTSRARALLDEYLAGVRRAQAADPAVDAETVVAGIREHVESELASRGVERATGEDVADVLERLGPPDGWAEDGPSGPGASRAVEGHVGGHVGLAAAGLVLVACGGVLIPGGALMGGGWALVALGAVLVRVSLGERGGAAGVEPGSPVIRTAEAVWWALAATLLAALALVPGGLVWGAFQTGGVLESWALDRAGAPTGARPAGYWPGVAAAIGLTCGVWWLGLGLGVMRFRTAVERLLGPARSLLPGGRTLVVLGGVVLAISIVGMVVL